MRIERREGAAERRIVTGMILDASVLGRISSKWTKEGLFSSPWVNLIAGWCVKYWHDYQKPPGRAIEGLFESWAAKDKDEDTVKLIEKFLSGLSAEYEQQKEADMNASYVIDLAGTHFNKVRLHRLKEQLEGDLDSNDLESAEKHIQTSRRVEMGAGSGIDLFQDKEAIRNAFAEKQACLVDYPGALGRFYQGELTRDAFIAYLGPEKSGKTWDLIDLSFRAMTQRRKVAFFEVGDMSEHQIIKRLMVRAARHPFKSPTGKWPYTVRYPISIESPSGEDSCARIGFEDKVFDRPLSWKRAWDACEKLIKTKVRSKESYFRLSCHPNNSVDVFGIQSILQSWELEGWMPDVIVIDYADLLAAPPGYKDKRDQIDLTWKMLRALSQSYHCLLATASQSDAGSYTKKTLDRTNFTDDKRKLAHCTGMIGINITAEEKAMDIVRHNWIVLREGEFSNSKCVHVARCLALANPCVRSTF